MTVQGAKRTDALCCPGSPMIAKGLCTRCYQKHQKLVKSGEASPYHQHIDAFAEQKVKRSAERAQINATRANERRRGDSYRDSTLRYRYGITAEQYDAMETEQKGLCFICNGPPPLNTRLYVDHCHSHGHVRRLLCPRCNTMIGVLENSGHLLDKAWKYLQQ